MPAGPTLLVLGCLLSVVGLVIAEARSSRIGKTVCKLLASTGFVLLAIALGATSSTYGLLVLVALVFSWLGDAFLLSRRSAFFLAGLLAFLLAHIVFAVAFAIASPTSQVLAPAFAVLAICGLVIMRWLWPHLSPTYRFAVGAYILAIVAMCALAVGLSTASGAWIYGVGALAFAASDLSVARDRFVVSSLVNKAWGLPVYYVAQLLLAWSVATHGAVAA